MSVKTDDRQSQIAAACSVLVRQVLADKNWRPAQLAAELGVHPDLVRRWVRGERMIQLDDLLTIADMGGASLDEVFAPARKTMPAGRAAADAHKAEAIAADVLRQLGQALSAMHPVTSALAVAPRGAGEGPTIEQVDQSISHEAQQALDDLVNQAKTTRRRRTA